MKILFIKEKRSTNGIEGIGIYLLNLCKELKRKKIPFLIIYNDDDELYHRFCIEKFNTRLIKLPPSTSRNLYSGYFERKNTISKIHQIVIKEKITHISVQFPFFLNYVSRKWKIPIFCHQHAAFNDNIAFKTFNFRYLFNFKKLINEFYRKYYVFNFSKVDKAIAVSKSSAETAKRKYKVDENKIVINEYGINRININDFKDIRKEFGFNQNDKIILCIGRISKAKGIEDFCEVAKQLKKYKFIFIGGYKNKKYYDYLQAKYSNVVYFTGPRNDVFDFYFTSDLFLFLSHRESAGLVLMEAMNFSLPLIGWDVCGVRDVIVNDENGYLCNFGKIDEVIFKINFILQNKNIYDNFSKQSFKLSYNYTIQKNASRLIKIFNNV